MANDLAARPLKIDTVMASGAGLGRPINVIAVYWLTPAALVDTFVIVDPANTAKILLQGKCEVVSQSQFFNFDEPLVWKDFRVSTLGSGTVFIYTT